jgi:Putative beta-barrel porin-2, OmpL-like. bbp2
MFRRKGLALIAACAALSYGGLVRAADLSSSQAPAQSPTDAAVTTDNSQPSMLDDATAPAPPPRKPLMWGLDKIGVAKTLDNLGININGYVEGSYTFDANHPTGNYFTGRSFDTESESLLLNQVDLNVNRVVDATKGKFDVGFTIEQIYGADAAYIHANGLTTYSPTKILGAYTAGPERIPKNQYDLNQAFLVFAIPVGKGITLTVGKFDTLIGYEVINPSGNLFYSHSFLFGQLPYTQTGAYAAYPITDTFTLSGGFSRGWDQALKDINGDLDMFGQVKYAKDKWTAYCTVSTGNQSASNSGFDGWRTVFDFIAQYAMSDNLSLAANADYGWQPQIAAGGNTAQWYGVAVYASYTLTPMFTLNGRGEWFNDPEGGAPASYNPGVANTYYEVTLGVAIKPMPNSDLGSNLVIRPEVRCDYANKGTWVGDNSHDQLTGAIEAYFTF